VYEQANPSDVGNWVVICNKHDNNVSKFRDKLGNTDWTGICGLNDPINSYSKFLHEFSEIFCRQKVCSTNFSKPWMTNSLLASIKRKNKLYNKYLRKPSFENKKPILHDFKNKLNHSIQIAKRLYFETKLKRATSDIKETLADPKRSD
jgi:hypothetical protein